MRSAPSPKGCLRMHSCAHTRAKRGQGVVREAVIATVHFVCLTKGLSPVEAVRAWQQRAAPRRMERGGPRQQRRRLAAFQRLQLRGGRAATHGAVVVHAHGMPRQALVSTEGRSRL